MGIPHLEPSPSPSPARKDSRSAGCVCKHPDLSVCHNTTVGLRVRKKIGTSQNKRRSSCPISPVYMSIPAYFATAEMIHTLAGNLIRGVEGAITAGHHADPIVRDEISHGACLGTAHIRDQLGAFAAESSSGGGQRLAVIRSASVRGRHPAPAGGAVARPVRRRASVAGVGCPVDAAVAVVRPRQARVRHYTVSHLGNGRSDQRCPSARLHSRAQPPSLSLTSAWILTWVVLGHHHTTLAPLRT